MNIYLISQDVNNCYDTYDSAVVYADTEKDARMISPNGDDKWNGIAGVYSSWCDAKDVKVKFLGSCAFDVKKGIILSSFNAG